MPVGPELVSLTKTRTKNPQIRYHLKFLGVNARILFKYKIVSSGGLNKDSAPRNELPRKGKGKVKLSLCFN
jgi:hypothetical protein